MIKIKRVLGVIIILALLVSSIPFMGLAVAAEDEPCDECQQSQAEGELQYPIMRPSPETLRRWMEEEKNFPEAYISPQIQRQLEQSPEIYGVPLSLLDHLQYTPSERDQGNCGNCWAWAGTGVMGIALDVQHSIKDRLSIQYLNSNYGGGSGPDFACCGGTLSDFTSFYNTKKKAIPWSNTNADWQDDGQGCPGSTTVPAGTISTTPYYAISSITAQTIPTKGVGEATAIANIQNILNQDKAIFFGFYLAESADWSAFQSFWGTQGEDVIWDPDSSCGHTADAGFGGHAVLCVGYNDDPGTDNDYWIMLNSWGTTASRPNGLFRVDMHMDYDCYFYYPYPDGYYSFYWDTLSATFLIPPTTPSDLVATAVSSSQINLSWTDNSGDETGFKIERKTGSGGTYVQRATVGANVTSYNNTGLSADTTYYYRVRAYSAAGNSDYSNEDDDTTLPPPPPAPVLTSPSYGETVSTLTPRLEWNASTGATDYGLQVATNSSFTTLVVDQTGITDLYYDIPGGNLSWNTRYYWRANASNSFGSTSTWSGSRYFRTAVGPPNPPTPVSPGTAITFKWSTSSGATNYHLQVNTNSSFTGTSMFDGEVGNVTSKEVTGLTLGTTYYWRVKAGNTGGWSDWSSVRSVFASEVP